MPYILLLDTETTNKPPTGKVIEIAVCLYDISHASPVISYASLLRCDAKNEAQEINRIDQKLLPNAPDPDDVWPFVQSLAEQSIAIVAHSAHFDKQFVPESVRNVVPWVCSKTDIKWPEGKMGEHLTHLALSYNLGIVSAHRAAADVDTLARIFSRVAEMGHALEPLIKQALRPKKRYVAVAPFNMKDTIKSHGFMWDEPHRQWWRMMPPEDIEALPFRVVENNNV